MQQQNVDYIMQQQITWLMYARSRGPFGAMQPSAAIFYYAGQGNNKIVT